MPETIMPQAQNPIRILFVCHDAGLYGSQQSLLQMVSNLAQDDRFEVFVSLARSGPFEDKIKSLKNVALLGHKRLQWVKHDPRSVFQKVGDLVSLAIGAIYRPDKLIQHIKNNQIDLVHTNSVVSLEGALAAKSCKVPHIWHVRELFMLENPKLNTILSREVTKKIIGNLSQKVVCISKMVQSQFEIDQTNASETNSFDCLNKYPVIYNAVDFTPLTDGLQREKNANREGFKLGYVGRLSEGKRFSDLIESLEFLPEDMGLTVVVAGEFVDEAYRKKIDSLLAQKKSGVTVEFLGHLPSLSDLYQSLDALVVPSLNEPFGRVVIEAASFNVPTLGADSGGLPEIIEDHNTGWLFPAKNPRALAALITTVVNDKDKCIEMGKNAGRMVRDRFTMDRQMTQLLDVYQSVLPQHPVWHSKNKK